jgi:hypothetical protein
MPEDMPRLRDIANSVQEEHGGFRADIIEAAKDGIAEIERLRSVNAAIFAAITAVDTILTKEQGRDAYHHGEKSVAKTLERVLERKRDMVTQTIARTREFQQDVLTFLKAFVFTLEMVASASTHAEKAARLRGLMELVDSAARKVRERQFHETSHWSYSGAIIRCGTSSRRHARPKLGRRRWKPRLRR